LAFHNQKKGTVSAQKEGFPVASADRGVVNSSAKKLGLDIQTRNENPPGSFINCNQQCMFRPLPFDVGHEGRNTCGVTKDRVQKRKENSKGQYCLVPKRTQKKKKNIKHIYVAHQTLVWNGGPKGDQKS